MIELYDYKKADGSTGNLVSDAFPTKLALSIITPAGEFHTVGAMHTSQVPVYPGEADYIADRRKEHHQDVVQHHMDNIKRLAVAEADFSFASHTWGLRLTRTPMAASALPALCATKPTTADAKAAIEAGITALSTEMYDGLLAYGCTFGARQTTPPERIPSLSGHACWPVDVVYETPCNAADTEAMIRLGFRALRRLCNVIADATGAARTSNPLCYIVSSAVATPHVVNEHIGGYPLVRASPAVPSSGHNISDVATVVEVYLSSQVKLAIAVPRLFEDVSLITLNPQGGANQAYDLYGLRATNGTFQTIIRNVCMHASSGTYSVYTSGRAWNASGNVHLTSGGAKIPALTQDGTLQRMVSNPTWLTTLDAGATAIREGAARQMYILPYEVASMWVEAFTITQNGTDIALNCTDIRASIPVAAVRAYLIKMRDSDKTTAAQKADIDRQLVASADGAETVMKATVTGDTLPMPFEILKLTKLWERASDADLDLYSYKLAENVTFKTAQNRINTLTPQRVWIHTHDDGALALSGLLSEPAQLLADRMEDKTLKSDVTIATHKQSITNDVIIRAYLNSAPTGVIIDSDDAIYLLSMGARVVSATENIVDHTVQSDELTLNHLGLLADYATTLAAKVGGAGLSGPDWAQLAPKAFTDAWGYPIVHQIADDDRRYRGIFVYKGVNNSDLEKFVESCVFFNEGLVEAIADATT